MNLVRSHAVVLVHGFLECIPHCTNHALLIPLGWIEQDNEQNA